MDTASGHVLLAFSEAADMQRMRAEHTAVDGEVPITEAKLQSTLNSIHKLGYLERDSQQSFGVVDISFPILGPDNGALAALTCPYIRRIDTHVGPDLQAARELLRQAAQTLSLKQGVTR
jgi:DNA-binding IclR family transcriptional regulator